MAAPNLTPAKGLQNPIRQQIQQRMQRLGVTGAAVALVENGQVTLAEGFGQTARRGGEPVTRQTLFQVGSVTKSLTALAVLQLRDRGLLELDAPVQRYLPYFAHAEITVRQLLNQTSGFGASAWRVGLDDPSVRASEENAVRAASGLALQTKPGASWMYSNINYMTLGALITAVAGQPYRSYMKQHLFTPLGMHQATFNGKLAVEQPYAHGYQGRLGINVEIPVDETTGWGDACGINLFLSAEDLAGYTAGLLRGRGSYAEAWSLTTDTMLKGMKYGFGWWSTEYLGERLVFVPGQAVGSNAILCLLPDRNLGVAVAANLYGDSATLIATEIIGALLGKGSAPRLMPNMARMIDPVFYGLAGVGLVALGGLAVRGLGGGTISLWVTALAGLLALLLLWAPGAMKRSPVMPYPLPAHFGPGGWPAELIAAWLSLLAAALGWTAYGLAGLIG